MALIADSLTDEIRPERVFEFPEPAVVGDLQRETWQKAAGIAEHLMLVAEGEQAPESWGAHFVVENDYHAMVLDYFAAMYQHNAEYFAERGVTIQTVNTYSKTRDLQTDGDLFAVSFSVAVPGERPIAAA